MSQPSNAFCRQGYLNGPSLRLHKIFGSVLFAGSADTLFGLLNLEDEGTTIFRNVGKYLLVDMTQQQRRLEN